MDGKVFYDTHCHAMNLSHPYLLAFIKRIKLPVILAIFAPFLAYFYKERILRVKNLISVMENDMGSFFLLMEKCVRRNRNLWQGNGKIKVGGTIYDKVIVTPLMVDFGYKGMRDKELYYNEPAQKPIDEQILDIFHGISRYLNISTYNILEIYPFLGLNTKNYIMDELKETLDGYFGDYQCNYKSLHQKYLKMKSVDIDIESIKKTNCFAGIKLYPPLGFDPWPDDSKYELAKVEYLYKTCCEKHIPITIHCNPMGFMVGEKSDSIKRTSPTRWIPVFEKYPTLKVNFAHMGRDGYDDSGISRETKKSWTEMILEYVKTYPNVFTDFSYSGVNPEAYAAIKKLIDQCNGDERRNLEEKIIFGSDFMINLLDIESYSGYIEIFSNSEYLTARQKNLFCNENPQRFLFR